MLKKQLAVYGITDKGSFQSDCWLEEVEQAIQGGMTMIQYREKVLPFEEQVIEAKALRTLTKKYGIPLIINDSVLLAQEVEADGVHLGQEDGGVAEARRALGTSKIIGVTAKTPEQAQLAQCQGADYLGSGAVFGSRTKLGATPLSYHQLKEIVMSVTIPVVAIGGINLENVAALEGSGVAGVAVISGLFKSGDSKECANSFRKWVQKEVER